MQIFHPCRNLGLFSEFEPIVVFFNLGCVNSKFRILITLSRTTRVNDICFHDFQVDFKQTFSKNFQIFLRLSLFTFLEQLLVIDFENSYYFYIKSPKLFEEIIKQYFLFIHLLLKLYFNIYEAEHVNWCSRIEVWQKFWFITSLILFKQYIF